MNNEELELVMLKRANSISSQKSLADEIGFSVGKINYVLKALVDKGFIKAERFLTSDNKTKYRYLLTDEGIHEKMQLTKKFIARKKAEYLVKRFLCPIGYEELQRDYEADVLKWGAK